MRKEQVKIPLLQEKFLMPPEVLYLLHSHHPTLHPWSPGLVLPGFLCSINGRADSTVLITLVSLGLGWGGSCHQGSLLGYFQSLLTMAILSLTPVGWDTPSPFISRNKSVACSDFISELCHAPSKGQKWHADALSQIKCTGQPGCWCSHDIFHCLTRLAVAVRELISLRAARKDKVVWFHLSIDDIWFITADNNCILEGRSCLQRDKESKRCSGASAPRLQAEPKTLGSWWRRHRSLHCSLSMKAEGPWVPAVLFTALPGFTERISCFIHRGAAKALGPKIWSQRAEAESKDKVQYSRHCNIE